MKTAKGTIVFAGFAGMKRHLFMVPPNFTAFSQTPPHAALFKKCCFW
ncbi:hypothetical protein AB434_0296 [Heyndrickxia coagulans]|uniref:Uncharacterized protein n=1 Tax=Heyndrickxia coagulans TaxID=1398 RepID=A0AAN0T3H7_HEYCO|nr:hypothetical protein SB48_HM08orf01380 [Heyndrickxia coagulans]AKN52701.1 hypothetical protein AB434_0296 [Heyndrickxia coagulans]